MKWGQFLSQLDELRSHIRQTKKAAEDVPGDAGELVQLANLQRLIVVEAPPPPPAPEPAGRTYPQGTNVRVAPDGERIAILPRENKPVPQPPVIVEVDKDGNDIEEEWYEGKEG